MRPWVSFKALVLVLSCTVGGVSLQQIQTRQALYAQEQAGLRMLSLSFSALLAKAEQANDDLAIQEIKNVLLRTPGVLRIRFPQRDELVVEGSAYLRTRLLGKQLMMSLLVFGGIGFVFLVMLGRHAKGVRQLHKQMSELRALLKEESQWKSKAQNDSERMLHERNELLSLLTGYIDRPLVVLDAQQRIVGVSRAVLPHLQGEHANHFIGKSWHEFPLLAGCGKFIEDTVSVPDDEHFMTLEGSSFSLRAKTFRLKGGAWIGISVE